MLLSLLTISPRGSLWPFHRWGNRTLKIQWQYGNKLPYRLESTALDWRTAMQSPLNKAELPTHTNLLPVVLWNALTALSPRRQEVGRFRHLVLRPCYLETIRICPEMLSICTFSRQNSGKIGIGPVRRNKVFGALLSKKDSTNGVREETRGSWCIRIMKREKLSELGRWRNE